MIVPMTAISPDAEPATRGDLERLRLEVQADIATLRADLERAMHAQTRWIIGAFGAIAAITVAILRLT